MMFKKYKLKEEYKQLFKTLSVSSDYLSAKECFSDISLPHRKSYGDAEEALKDDSIIKKLEGADFLECKEMDVDVVEKP